MKIALVVHDLHEHAGHSLYTRILADELSQRHQVTVFANQCERPENAGWDFHPVRAWRANALSAVQTFPLGIRSLSRALAKFDIVHAQGYCGGRPNVVTAHICVAAYLKSLRSPRSRNRASLTLMAAAEGRFYRRYQGRVIAISEKIARELRDYYQVTAPIDIIPHGVDATRIAGAKHLEFRAAVRAELSLGEMQVAALYVGDLTKAHALLKTLSKAAPEIQLLVVSRSSGYRWTADNVRFLPPTTELSRFYAAADAFVFPTTYDAFGMVVLEAMANGLPVFSSDQAGAATLIKSGQNGFVAGLDEWVEVTANGLKDLKRLRMLGKAARQSALLHDWTTVIKRVEAVYAETVSPN